MKLTGTIRNMLKKIVKNNKYAFFVWTCAHYSRNPKFMEKVVAISRDPNVLFIHHNGSLYPNKLIYYMEFEDEKSGFCAIYRNTLGSLNFAEQWGGTGYSLGTYGIS